ncbi:MAG TPA: hypothetical protein VIM56_03775 [Rhizomicrobium sp.]
MIKPFLTPDEVAALEAGSAGALLTLLFGGQITTWRAIMVFASGLAASFWGAHPLSQWLGFNEGLLGLLLGICGFWIMAFFVKSFQMAIDNPRAVWEQILKLLPWVKGGQK